MTKEEVSCCSGSCDSRGALIFGWSSVVESPFNSYNMKLKQVKIHHLILHLSLQFHSFHHYRHFDRLCPIDIISWIKRVLEFEHLLMSHLEIDYWLLAHIEVRMLCFEIKKSMNRKRLELHAFWICTIWVVRVYMMLISTIKHTLIWCIR